MPHEVSELFLPRTEGPLAQVLSLNGQDRDIVLEEGVAFGNWTVAMTACHGYPCREQIFYESHTGSPGPCIDSKT